MRTSVVVVSLTMLLTATMVLIASRQEWGADRVGEPGGLARSDRQTRRGPAAATDWGAASESGGIGGSAAPVAPDNLVKPVIGTRSSVQGRVPAAPADDATPSQPAAAQERRLMVRFSSEERDAAWAEMAESAILMHAARARVSLSVLQVDCKRTVCRLHLVFPSRESFDQHLDRNTLPSFGPLFGLADLQPMIMLDAQVELATVDYYFARRDSSATQSIARDKAPRRGARAGDASSFVMDCLALLQNPGTWAYSPAEACARG